MLDTYGRNINYLRLSVTDRCNLRCQYCMPAGGIKLKQSSDILSYEEMLRIVSAGVELGIRKVRVTGGEPLVRKGLVGFLAKLSALPGVDEVALTTNGTLLDDHARALRDAGVKRLNVSVDSLQPETYTKITRGGSLSKVFQGLAAAESAGLKLKLNMVVMRGINDQEIVPFARLSLSHPCSVRFIEYMPTIRQEKWQQQLVSGKEILGILKKNFRLKSISSGRYCGPAKPYRIESAPGTIGVITPMSDHFCGSCNRIRVTSTGWAKSCLFSDKSVDLRPSLKHSQEQLKKILQSVISNKQAEHLFGQQLNETTAFSMASIGG